VDRLAILDHGRVIVEGSPASLKEGLSSDLRLELVLEPGAELPPMPACVQRSVSQGERILATVPGPLAAEAVAWAQGLHDQDLLEEFSLSPATLEDAYIEFVDRADAERRPGQLPAIAGPVEEATGAADP